MIDMTNNGPMLLSADSHNKRSVDGWDTAKASTDNHPYYDPACNHVGSSTNSSGLR